MKTPTLISNDPWLEPYREAIVRRMEKALAREKVLAGEESLQSFASGHLWFGLHKHQEGMGDAGMGPAMPQRFTFGAVQRLGSHVKISGSEGWRTEPGRLC